MNKLKTSAVALVIAASGNQPAAAGWCEGSKYFLMDMSMSERVEKAGDALQDAMRRLSAKAGKLKLDMQTEAERTRQELERQYADLTTETEELCQNGKQGSYPVRYHNIELQNASELRARLRLNLDLLQAQRAAATETASQKDKMQKLAVAMLHKHSTLSVLLKQLEAESGMNASPRFASQFVQSACIAVNESEQLLKKARLRGVDELLAEKILQRSTDHATEEELDNFMKSCRVEDIETKVSVGRKWLDKMVRKVNGWF